MAKTIYIQIIRDGSSLGNWGTQQSNEMLPLPSSLNDILQEVKASAYNFVFSFEGIDGEIELLWRDGGEDGWPPSVDSWVIMRDLLRQNTSFNPISLIDIGAGSGILGLASLIIYDTLKEICFVENEICAAQKLRDYWRHSKVKDGVTITMREEDAQWTLFAQSNNAPNEEHKFDLLVAAPPYLPGRTISEDKDWLLSSTTGNALLLSIITNRDYIARRCMVYFGEIAISGITKATDLARNDPRFRAVGYVPLMYHFTHRSITETDNSVTAYFEKFIPHAEFLQDSSQGDWISFADIEASSRNAILEEWKSGVVNCRQVLYCFDSADEEETAEVSS